MRIKNVGILLVAGCCLANLAFGAESERRVLLYTKNQVGKNLFVHDNIAASVKAIQKLGADNGFIVDVSDDPGAFTDANLKKYKALIFDNTNNEIFDTEEQKAALQHYIHAGGGFVGIHSATGSMRQWPWFWSLIGGKFSRHAALQSFTLKVKDANDPSTAHLPLTFEWTDEFYYVTNIPAGRHVLLVGDMSKLRDAGKAKFPGPQPNDEYPLAWKHEFEGGRAWYTSLGHKPEYYSDPKLANHILGGILWAMGEKGKPGGAGNPNAETRNSK
jgi:uncharacterized protein